MTAFRDHARGAEGADDPVAIEAPLEIRVDDVPRAVLMRSPGDDRALAAGFLLAAGVVDQPDDLMTLTHCEAPDNPNARNTMIVRLAPGCDLERLQSIQRGTLTPTGCGLCGATCIDDVLHVMPNDRGAATAQPFDPAALEEIATAGYRYQPGFQATGGLHGALLWVEVAQGAPDYSAEDVGRHNAVDKVLGAAFLADGLPLPGRGGVLWVSGRASFDLLQKAAMGGVDSVVCVGPPSTLAVEMASRAGINLIGFATGPGRFNVYAGSVRAPAACRSPG